MNQEMLVGDNFLTSEWYKKLNGNNVHILCTIPLFDIFLKAIPWGTDIISFPSNSLISIILKSQKVRLKDWEVS